MNYQDYYNLIEKEKAKRIAGLTKEIEKAEITYKEKLSYFYLLEDFKKHLPYRAELVSNEYGLALHVFADTTDSVCMVYNLVQDYFESLVYFKINNYSEFTHAESFYKKFSVTYCRCKSSNYWDRELSIYVYFIGNQHCRAEEVTKTVETKELKLVCMR